MLHGFGRYAQAVGVVCWLIRACVHAGQLARVDILCDSGMR